MKRKRIIVAALLLLLLLGFLLGGSELLFGDRQLSRAQELRDQLRGEAARKLTPEERRKKFQELRRAMGQLSPSQRAELGKERRKQMQKRLQDYFALSPRDRQAFLDKQINQMEARRKQWQQNRNRNPGQGPQGNRGGGPGGPGGNPQARWDRKMAWLDQTTPEERAQISQFRQDLRQRMQQRGFAPWGGR